jgi:hypothetical protein
MMIISTKNGNLSDKRVENSTFMQETAVMFKIVRFPKKLESFFQPLENQFHWDHFEYFRTLVLLFVFAWGRRNISSLYRHLDSRNQPHRSRFNNFLNVGRWEPKVALQLKAHELLALLNPQKGEVIELILDDSKKQKRGKTMDAVGWIHDPVTNRTVKGHQYVTAVLRFHGHVIPWGIRLYIKKEDAARLGQPFKKTTELAADLIRAFDPPQGVHVRVLFDSYYLCPVVVKACRQKKYRFISTLAANRNLYKNGRKLKAGQYGRNLFNRSRKTSCRVQKANGCATYTYVDAGTIAVSDLGPLHVIFSRKNHDKKTLGIVTDDPKLSAGQMIRTYDDRWSIEVFFKDGKQLLGLGQYQNVSFEAAVTHLHLVCFAYALLTHIAITGEGAKAQRKPAVKLSTADLQNEARRIVWDDLTQHLKKLSSGTQIVKELGRLLIAA